LVIVRNAADDFRLRLLTAKAYTITEKSNVYNEKIEREYLREKLDEIIDEELLRQRILRSLMKKSQSVKEVAQDIEVSSKDVLEHLVVLRDRGLVGLEKIEGSSPIYNYTQKE
jgi:hypothetical protein